MKKLTVFIAAIVLAAITSAQGTYTLDKNHSQLSFSIVHLGISHVEGFFRAFDATLLSSKDDFTDAQITLTADVKSINTQIEMRDKDLQNAKWFDSEKYPSISFKSTSFQLVNDKSYKLSGNIMMHGVTKPITIDVVFNGKVQNPFTKKFTYVFSISGKLDRTDFGIGAEPLATGVGAEVDLKANVEFVLN